jgi:lysozyme family protein
MVTVSFTSSLSAEYQRLFDSCRVRAERAKELDALVGRVAQGRDRYQSVGGPLGVPWYFVGVIHGMEASFNFTRHLHNGDPLTARTVQEPPNRPPTGQPPFTWEESATDALRMKKLMQVTDWNLPRTLYQLEAYNGFGYRTSHPEVLTPYLWSYSEHYTMGKYVADGTFSATAVSKQCGAAVMMRRMAEAGIIEFKPDGMPITGVGADTGSSTPLFDQFGPVIRFSTAKSPGVEALQTMLNTFPGIFVKVDGIPGTKTSDAFKKVTGHFLSGDPRANAGQLS